jgi:predicted AAA+ superfamily ATPase
MKNILKTIIVNFQTARLKTSLSRNVRLPVDSGIIISVIGVRRSGKTYLLFETIKRILESGIPKRNIMYINFEDERLTLTQDQLDLILQAYQELFPKLDLAGCYFFFDEIQNIAGWEKFVRRVFDSVSKNIFITGSNSRLLSTEIATELRGRTISYTLYPLSFDEYLRFNKADSGYFGTSQRINILSHFNEFMVFGGFPELIDLNETLKIKKLQDYFNSIIYKDLIERYNISNPAILKFFIKKIISQVTKPVSINKIYNDFKSLGYKVSNNLLYEYSEYIQTSFTAILINKFEYSEIKQAKSEKKAYAVDNGILTAVDYSFSENHGKLLENMIALEILKSGKELMYFKNNLECDFIIRDKKSFSPVQVIYSIQDPDTKGREIKGLLLASEYLKMKKGTIVTYEEEDNFNINNFKIEVIPAYKFILGALNKKPNQ